MKADRWKRWWIQNWEWPRYGLMNRSLNVRMKLGSVQWMDRSEWGMNLNGWVLRHPEVRPCPWLSCCGTGWPGRGKGAVYDVAETSESCRAYLLTPVSELTFDLDWVNVFCRTLCMKELSIVFVCVRMGMSERIFLHSTTFLQLQRDGCMCMYSTYPKIRQHFHDDDHHSTDFLHTQSVHT